MNAARSLARLRRLGVTAFSTADAAALLSVSVSAAAKTLRRLADAGLLHSVRCGLWTLDEPGEPFALLEYVTAPCPAYVSLQTALYLNGMIEQVPSLIYAVSLSRSHRVRTSVGTFSIHRIAPGFFGGFEVSPRSGAKIAGPEKALLDIFYLSAGRSRLFASLPEVELTPGFRFDVAREWIGRIPSARLRTIVSRRLDGVARRGMVEDG
jgi:predicted transcriptional regulator of viral defense system